MTAARGWFEPANASLTPPAGPPPAGDGAADATAVLPAVSDDRRTAVIPRVREPADETRPEAARAPAQRGVRVIPLRPVRVDDGYRSVYSEATRTTPVTVLRTVARGTGEVLITLGLIVLLFAAYEVWGKAAIVGAEQTDLDRQLAQEWGAQPPGPGGGQDGMSRAQPPPPGNGLSRMYIPRIGKHWVVVQGVRPSDIRYAPGHYPDTALPGQVGNFSVAGHRTPAIFWDLDKVKEGDTIVVETRQTWYVYTVTQSHIVLPNAVQVVAPVPNKPGTKPTVAMLTLTTCHPKYNNYQRLVVHAQLTRSQPQSAGRPAEIGG
jgi:sortase A